MVQIYKLQTLDGVPTVVEFFGAALSLFCTFEKDHRAYLCIPMTALGLL